MTFICTFLAGCIRVCEIYRHSVFFKIRNVANSEPLSPVTVLNTWFFLLKNTDTTSSKASCIASAVWFLAFIQRHILVIRSTSVITTGLFSFFSPRTLSIYQCPNSFLSSTLSGRSSILLPSFFLFSAACVFAVFRFSFSGRSMFLIGNNPSET